MDGVDAGIVNDDVPLVPVFALDGPLDPGSLDPVLRQAIEAAAPAWLPARRWFGDKTRTITGVTVRDLAETRAGEQAYVFAIAEVRYDQGTSERYLLPLVVTRELVAPDATLAILAAGDDRHIVADGPESEGFRVWLLDLLAERASIESERGSVRFDATGALADYLPAARTGPSRLIRSEQSNTSVIYGDAIILKLFRKLQPGLNPDVEIGRFLTERTEFRNAPALTGEATYTSDTGDTMSVAVFQTFVPSVGDAWTSTGAELTEAVARWLDAGSPPVDTGAIDASGAELLGRRTGQLHVALASRDDDPAFAPEPVEDRHVAEWTGSTVASATRQQAAIRRAEATLPPDLVARLERLDLSEAAITRRAAGYERLIGTMRIRVHGDYHLGQVLRTLDGDFMILDFEGAPSRPISERRRKMSALMDVAGMLQSYRFARGAAAKARRATMGAAPADDWLDAWERASRSSFVRGYLEEVAMSPVPLVPSGETEFAAALAAWELDKALYDIGYEANNRPDWIDIPLSMLLIE